MTALTSPAPVRPRVENGILEAADRLERAFGLARALAVVERWAAMDDPRWGQVAALLRRSKVAG